MDHGRIVELALVERYLDGDLPPEEEIRFESHFMGCAECQEELMLERGLRRGMRSLATEESVRGVARAGIVAWLTRRGWAVRAGLMLLLLVVVALPSAWLLVEQRTGSAVSTPSVVLLAAYRGDLTAEPVRLDLADAEGPSVLLAVDPGADPGFVSYGLTLADAEGRPVVQRAGLRPTTLEVLMLQVPTDLLSAGEYRLRLDGTSSDGRTVELAVYRLRVTAP